MESYPYGFEGHILPRAEGLDEKSGRLKVLIAVHEANASKLTHSEQFDGAGKLIRDDETKYVMGMVITNSSNEELKH